VTSSGKIVLVADDLTDDFLLLKAAFRKAGLPHRLVHVDDGDHAIMYLEGISPYCDRQRFPFPDLLILDVQMPNTNGFDVLTVLRKRPHIALPVVMFSSSNIVRDIQLAAELGAIHFFTKPLALSGMTELVKTIDERWLSKVPKESARSVSRVGIQAKTPSAD
jgi:CheY-like chemotaxis protein